jgi:phthalate 4,5-dioxygenase reductase subunit
VHFEDFGTSLPVVEVDSATFSVTLARSGVSIKVNPDTSILAAIRKQGISVPSSCESGTCGECRTSLISGIVDHQDFVLDDDEHDKAIMICVSRAKSAELVLDL